MIQRLTIEDIRSIFVWLKEHQIEFNAGRMHRDFSDCVNVAKILKQIYPRMVEMNNYPKRNNTSLKINNWETLNFKVLEKLGLHLSEKRIVKLANGKPGVIELLLHQIMTKEIEYRRENDTTISLQEQIWTENDEVVVANVQKLMDDEVIQTPEKLILYSIYDEMRRKSQMLSTDITAKMQKIAHLENLKQLKAEHINEICGRLAKTSVRALMQQQQLNVELDSVTAVPGLDLRDIVESENKSSADSRSCQEVSELL